MSPRILIVDDVQSNLTVLEMALDDLSLKIDKALSGEAALIHARKGEYAVILMDINMPNMNGFECVKEIRQLSLHLLTPVIFITAAGNHKSYVDQGYNVGAIDYLTKPFDHDILCSKVNIFLALFNERKNTEDALRKIRELQRQHEQLLNFTAEGIIGLDINNIVTFANTAACTLLTANRDAIVGHSIKDFVDPLADSNAWGNSEFVQTFKEKQCNQNDNDFFWRNKKAKFPVLYTQSSIIEDDTLKGGVIIFQDISERKEIETQLVNLAKFDQLTGLANRRLYWEFLEKITANSRRGDDKVCILFLDLDHFKEVNDSLGHDAGDLLLVQAAERLKGVLRDADLIARLGGDEFAIVLQKLSSFNDAAKVAQKIISLFSKPFYLFGKNSYIGTSIGIASFPEHGVDAATLTKAADTAMYHAKKNGRNNFKFFDNVMHMRVKNHVEVTDDLRHAIKEDHIEPYYQPIIKVSTRETIGFEALARWQHREKGMIPPAIFIPIAEEAGLIEDVGKLMLLKAGQQAKQWFKHDQVLTIAINVAARQLRQKNFSKQILTTLENHQISAHHVKLELTESALMENPDDIARQLKALRREGISIAIDDFGTGYSSLSYLKKFPIDILKIDQSFVGDIGKDSNDEVIINAIIQMAHTLGLEVIAEGVETHEQLDFLTAHQCDYIQGYLFGKPLPRREAEQFLPVR